MKDIRVNPCGSTGIQNDFSSLWLLAFLLFVFGVLFPLLFVVAAQPEVAEPDDAPGPITVKEMPELGSYWPGRCVRVIDGDTIDVEVKKIIRVRLNVWCPELHGRQREAGLKAKFTLAKAIENKMGVVVIPWKDSLKDELTLNRVLGRFVVNGDDAGGMMIRKKLGAATKEGLAELYPE